MKNEIIYESNISDARWMIYDVPGNVGWIMYLICLFQCFAKRPAFLEIPLVQISAVVGILPAVAMIVGIVELISERVLKLDRILPKKRLFRGFSALTWGGFGGVVVGLTALFAAIQAGYSVKECKLLLLLAVGSALCTLFAGLILKTFRPKNQEKEKHEIL